MKKILLIALLVLSNLLFVKAEELPTFEVGSYNAIVGEEITISVSIKNNAGFNYIGFKLEYDTTSLEYVDSRIIGLDDFELKQITNNSNNKIVMYAISLADSLMKENGEIAKIKFKVKENAKTSDLKIDVTDYGVSSGEAIKFDFKNGKVTISNANKVGDTLDTKDDFEVENPSDYKWESSDNSVASVSEDGKITFKKDGDVTITQKDKDGNVINSKVYKISNNQNKNENENNLTYIIIIIVVIIILLVLAVLSFNFIKKRKIDNSK